MTIAIVGLGLIGGSWAKALRKHTGHTVIGVDASKDVCARAIALGAITRAGDAAAAGDADVVILALYPAACIAWMRDHAQHIRPGAVVTDCCGVKKPVCDVILPFARARGFHFVGSHPMAGRERSGFDASDADLFEGASLILTPEDAASEAVECLRALAAAVRFGRVLSTTPAEHDARVAYTSQLPHVLAAAYVQSPRCAEHDGFSAGSYLDVSRVARINAAMWAELFLQNAPALTHEVDILIENLQAIRASIAAGDETRLQDILQNARRVKEMYG